jgi:hypothetical protein
VGDYPSEVLSVVAGPLRLASFAICLVVIASFALFVVNQASEASSSQVAALGGPNAARSPAKKPVAANATLRTRIDEVSNDLTSPFSGVTAGSSSQWTIHGVNLLLTLVIYGFCLSFLARIIRMR